jgi:hypothetical protein
MTFGLYFSIENPLKNAQFLSLYINCNHIYQSQFGLMLF